MSKVHILLRYRILIASVSELLIINTLATAKPRTEPEVEAAADLEHFDTFWSILDVGTFKAVLPLYLLVVAKQ